MKKKLEKIYNISAATIFSIYALISLIFVLFVPKYNILFSGWWALIIILPALGSFLFQRNKLGSLYLLLVGVCCILVSNDILTLKKCFTILLCLGIIFVGINIVKETLKIPEKKNSISKYIPLYYAFLGSTEEKVTTEFKGGYTKVFFGYMNLDLKNAIIENNSTLKVISVFGTTDIYLPENIEVLTTNTNILGGTENLKETSQKSKKTNKLYVESISILGNTKIK